MFKLLIWIVWLTVLLALCVIQSPRRLLTPQFVFIGCFIPQAIFATLFVDEWDLDFCNGTMICLFGGTALFFVLSVILEGLFSKIHISSARTAKRTAPRKIDDRIKIERWKLILYLVLQVGILFFVIKYFIENIPGNNILAKIANYDNLSKRGTDKEKLLVELPDLIDLPRIFCGYSCYYMGYLLVHSIVMKYQQHRVLLLLNVVTSLLFIGVLGGRIGIMAFIVTTVAEAYILWGKKNSWKKRLRFKSILKIIILGLVVVFTFQLSLILFGRKSDDSFVEHLGVYLSAPLKNSDIFISKGKFGVSNMHYITMCTLLVFLGKRFNIKAFQYRPNLPYNVVHGHQLGNAYAIFYFFMRDGGYVALVGFVTLMVLISQVVYQRVICNRSPHPNDISIIAYSYMVYTLSLSFFGCLFYSSFLDISFLEIMFACWVLKVFFTKVHFRGRGKAAMRQTVTFEDAMTT